MAYQVVDFGPSRKEGAEEGIDRDDRVPNPREAPHLLCGLTSDISQARV
jgi:hypothetical protein